MKKKLRSWFRYYHKLTCPQYYFPNNAYGNASALETLGLPQKIDLNSVSQLCGIMAEFGSDKGGYVGRGKHNYSLIYSILFEKYRVKKFNMFELGIGSADTSFRANMGTRGKPGASLKAWKRHFEKANIYSADIDSNILFSEHRITTYHCDQTNPEEINKMWNSIGVEKKFEVIIDDGLHEFFANVCFLENSISMLEEGGGFVVEDVLSKEIKKWKSYLKKWKLEEGINFWILKIPNPHNSWDNNLVVIKKK